MRCDFVASLIALSETYLNESIKDEDIRIEGYSREIFRSDHPNGKKEGGVCLYFKESLPIKRRKDLEIIQETVICEIPIRRKKVFFIAMYRSPNQSNEEFDEFYDRLQEILDIIKDAKPHCVILTGDLNCRSKQFWSDDIDSPKKVALDELIESNNLTQLIDQPTNTEPRGKSCVDLIITDQPNLFVDYGIHSSLDNNCHHQIIHGKINISVPSPPPYKRQIWDYAKADKDEIRQFLTNIDWISKFKDLSVSEMAQQFTSTVMGMMLRFIPNKMIVFNDKDPPWITPAIKTAIKRKHRVYNRFAKRGHKPEEWEPVRMTRNETSRMITDAKENYFSTLGRKLSNPALGLKTFILDNS